MVRKFAGILAAAVVGLGVAASGARATTNLALGKPTLASSESFGAGSLAVDGNTNTTYAAGSIFQTGLDSGANWAVILGADYLLHDVNIYQRTDELPRLLHNFTVTVFTTLGAVTYTQTFATAPGATVTTPFDIVFDTPVLGGAVQIILSGTDYLALAEVQVFGSTLAESAVPEPASMALLAAGLIGAAAARRASRSKPVAA